MKDESPRALISVFDKDGISDFAQKLTDLGWEILSTGGTSRLLREKGIDVTDVTDVTGHPEVFNGRVKTLHPAIHAAILARGNNPEDMSTLDELGYPRIDLVAVNLYPFEEVAARDPPVSEEELIEMIDIGGPTLVRAAAKSHQDVLIVTNPDDYNDILELLEEADGSPSGINLSIRQRLALTAYQRTAAYDVALANTLATRLESLERTTSEFLPEKLLISGGMKKNLRYGENPHQPAAFYPANVAGESLQGLASARQHGG
ncbi:MAG: bifunctional phosphoribosylaminoimidazolecarboxamide formyltransferase/IMP cyclohydrolase, partial [Candidatus Thermoplasmatota archaeon]|nr:bifunctional phosphoribosylaminoimidazolecarboxamide formyltransferase/IMP cyclohydrolase [Candidatus Thermoplasmatota archaeon]